MMGIRKILESSRWASLGLLLAVARLTLGPIGPAAAAQPLLQVATIGAFIEAIDEGRDRDAIEMMSPALVPDAAARAAWKREFLAILAIHLVDVVETKATADAPCATYRVTLDVRLDPKAAGASIPNYGWDGNRNLRWIELCPDDGGAWKISSIGTGP